jgi:hypothetical protein
MRGRQCEDRAYAAKKGEPVFRDCLNCTPAKCDRCGEPLGPNYFSTNGEDYLFAEGVTSY